MRARDHMRGAHRRPGVGSARRSGFRGAGGNTPAEDTTVDLATAGTFTRGSEAFRLLGAETDGSSAFADWAGSNVRRVEPLGLLIEGARTQLVPQPQDLAHASWTLSGTRTPSSFAGPDGTAARYRIEATAAQLGLRVGAGVALTAIPYALSAYMRAFTGASEYSLSLCNGAFSGGYMTSTASSASTTWARRKASATPTAATYFPTVSCGVVLSNLGGGAANPASAKDHVYDLIQLEAGAFASSPIRTAATRAADVLTIDSADVPTGFWTTGFRFTFAPLMTSAQHVTHNAAQQLVYLDANNFVRLQAGAATLELQCGGSSATIAITWTADLVLTISVEPALGRITVSGATTGDGNATAGVPAAWTPGTLAIGGDGAGALCAFGHFGTTMEGL
jgi:hypothetical protein